MAITLALMAFVLLVSVAMFFLIRREIRTSQVDLLNVFRKAHGSYSDPSAAAVVTSPEPAPVAPVPVHARATVPGLSTPFRPTPDQAFAALTADAEEKRAIRARHEAEADVRSVARLAADDEPEEEPTTIFPGESRHETVHGIPALTRPAPERARALEAFWKRHTAPTLASAMAVPSDPIEARYAALCDSARGRGLAADHCAGPDCWGEPEGVLCTCGCDGCVRATGYSAQAEREVMGPPPGDSGKRRE